MWNPHTQQTIHCCTFSSIRNKRVPYLTAILEHNYDALIGHCFTSLSGTHMVWCRKFKHLASFPGCYNFTVIRPTYDTYYVPHNDSYDECYAATWQLSCFQTISHILYQHCNQVTENDPDDLLTQNASFIWPKSDPFIKLI